jgi:Mg2+ and Co2+ transporter CorA
MEPIVYGFVRESEILLNLSREIAITERFGITSRGFIAKEIASSLHNEIKDKLKAIVKVKKLSKILTYASRNRIRFMQSRFQEMNQRMKIAASNIDNALEAFSKRIDISLAHYNKRLNKIMLTLTVTTICLIPPQVIAGIMGMNVHVPF